jgi:hypothetical protein
MKTIQLTIEDDAINELKSLLGIRKMHGDDMCPDYQFIFGILYALHREWSTVIIGKEWLEKNMRDLIKQNKIKNC